MRVVRGRRWRRTEFRRDREDIVRFGVERHGARSRLGLHIFRDAEFLRRVFFHDGQYAFTARGERQSGFIVVGGCVDTFADRGSCQDFAAIGIDYGHHLVIAADEEAAVLAVEGQSAGLGAGRERPLRFHFQLVGIDHGQFALVFDIDEDLALGVAGRELGLAVELDRAEHFAAGGIDGGGVLAASVEGEDALGRRIVENRVGILADFHFFSNGLQTS